MTASSDSFLWQSRTNMAKDEVVEILRQLIRIPSFVTEKPSVNENNLVNFIEVWLKKNTRLKIERQDLVGNRFNLIAKQGDPTILFLGHTDTVQPNKDALVDQLSGKIINDEIWGRGATDMKSGLAALMSAAHFAKRAKNYWLLFYADEEYDFLGMKGLVQKYGNLKPKALVSADGSDLAVGNGCRGLIELTYRTKGETGHPAKGTGKNAIWGTIEVLTGLKKYLAGFTHPIMGETSFNLAYLHGGAELATSVGTQSRLIEVGKAGNVVPDICEFTVDIRPAKPDLDADKVIEFLEEGFKKNGLGYQLIERKHDLGAWYTDPGEIHKYANLAEKTTGFVKFSDPRQTGYLDLQMLWDVTGRPTSLMFGGGIGSTAHRPDERIAVDDLIKTRDFFQSVMEDLT